MKKKVSLAKRLKLAEARADDAQRQFNEAERRRRELQIEANLWHGKFKDAQMHAKVEHDLLTETLRQEVSRLTGESQKLRAKNEALVAALAHSDAERRKLERDVLAQRAELAKLQPFNRILGAFPARGPIA